MGMDQLAGDSHSPARYRAQCECGWSELDQRTTPNAQQPSTPQGSRTTSSAASESMPVPTRLRLRGREGVLGSAFDKSIELFDRRFVTNAYLPTSLSQLGWGTSS